MGEKGKVWRISRARVRPGAGGGSRQGYNAQATTRRPDHGVAFGPTRPSGAGGRPLRGPRCRDPGHGAALRWSPGAAGISGGGRAAASWPPVDGELTRLDPAGYDEAIFGRAVALEELGRTAEAAISYRAYVVAAEMSPRGASDELLSRARRKIAALKNNEH